MAEVLERHAPGNSPRADLPDPHRNDRRIPTLRDPLHLLPHRQRPESRRPDDRLVPLEHRLADWRPRRRLGDRVDAGHPHLRRLRRAVSDQFWKERSVRRTRPMVSASVHMLLAMAAVVSLVPFVWLLCASIKTGQDLYTYTFLPSDLRRLTLENYALLFKRQFFGRWIVNSIFLASFQTTLIVALASLGGFALAKYNFRFKRTLQLIMLATMLLPSQVLLP